MQYDVCAGHAKLVIVATIEHTTVIMAPVAEPNTPAIIDSNELVESILSWAPD
jgi:hypothetical protein